MAETDRLIDDFTARKSYSVTATTPREGLLPIPMQGRFVQVPVWISFALPLGMEEGSCQVTEIIALGAPKEFEPRTALGKKLLFGTVQPPLQLMENYFAMMKKSALFFEE